MYVLEDNLTILLGKALYAPEENFTTEYFLTQRKKIHEYAARLAMRECEKDAAKSERSDIRKIQEYIHRYGEAPEHGITQVRVDDYLKNYVYVARGENE